MKIKPHLFYDGYKCDHRRQYPENSLLVFSNLTARGSRVKGLEKVFLFGLQAFIKKHLLQEWGDEFFAKDVEEVVASYNRRLTNYLGPNAIGEQHIRDLHALGYLPLEIWALPEGSNVNLRVPMFVMWNTDDRFFWLTNAIETIISASTWGPCTSTTTAVMYRKILNEWANKTNPEMIDFVPWQGHDFSFRGHFGHEAAVMSGAGHLLAFTGTDTVPAIDWLEEYYNADSDKELVGGSVSATEHSVMCMGMAPKDGYTIPARVGIPLIQVLYDIEEEAPKLYELAKLVDHQFPSGTYDSMETDGHPSNSFTFFRVEEGKIVAVGEETPRDGGVYWTDDMEHGRPEVVVDAVIGDELGTFKRLITELYPNGIVSIVSDTWDFWEVIDPTGGILTKLKSEVMARDGKVVIRPDSGDPVKIVTGYMPDEIERYKMDMYRHYYRCKATGKELTENEVRGMIVCLWEIFGGTTTSKGYKQLDSHIGAIYGDSITLERATQICERLEAKGFASTNLVYGIGSFTYQGAITADAIITRDTHGFAVKSTYGEVLVDGERKGIEIFKDPKTDDGLKKSAKGLIAVYEDANGDFSMKDQATWDEVKNCAFKQVFLNSSITSDQTLAEIRERVAKNF